MKKLNRRQLRNIISNTLNEGFFGDVYDKMTYGEKTKDLLKNSSQDALDVFDACAGLGTDEEKIKSVIEKRSKDLHKLYVEFHNLIVNYTTANLGFKSQEQQLLDSNYNQDLIAWLEEDGMEEEAILVSDALKAKNIQRQKIPKSVSRIF